MFVPERESDVIEIQTNSGNDTVKSPDTSDSIHVILSGFSKENPILTEMELQVRIMEIMHGIEQKTQKEIQESYYKLRKDIILGLIFYGLKYDDQDGIVTNLSRIYGRLETVEGKSNFDVKLDLFWAHMCLPDFNSRFVLMEKIEEVDINLPPLEYCRSIDTFILIK